MVGFVVCFQINGTGSNFLILNQPTNHLDLESIQAVNDGCINYRGCILFTSNDPWFIDSVANVLVEITKWFIC